MGVSAADSEGIESQDLTIFLALVALAVSLWPARQLGTEFMPS